MCLAWIAGRWDREWARCFGTGEQRTFHDGILSLVRSSSLVRAAVSPPRLGIAALLLVLAVVSGCSDGQETGGAASENRDGMPAQGAVDGCRVTLPVHRTAEPPAEVVRLAGSSRGLYGQEDLWVALNDPDAELIQNPDGSYAQKFMWWRLAEGNLVLTAHSVGEPGLTAETDVPDGYGSRGFQATGVNFPTEGCWRVTGELGDQAVTFVVAVP